MNLTLLSVIEGCVDVTYIYIYRLHLYIYIIQQFSLKYVAFESTLLNFTQNPYEIGPSNAS